MPIIHEAGFRLQNNNRTTFIQGKELGEVVVKSSYLTREGDHILAIPTKEQRKHAVTGYDLLSNLMIPGASVKRSTGSVTTTPNGATKTIYANPPADGSSYDYTLIKVVSKMAKGYE